MRCAAFRRVARLLGQQEFELEKMGCYRSRIRFQGLNIETILGFFGVARFAKIQGF